MKKLFSIFMVFAVMSLVFVSCTAPSGKTAKSASESEAGTDSGTSTDSGTEDEGSVSVPSIPVSIDRTTAAGVTLDVLIAPMEWRAKADQAIPYAQFGKNFAIYIHTDPEEDAPASWGTWSYVESIKEFAIRTAFKLFFEVNDQGMWTGNLVLNDGTVLYPFKKE